MCGYDYYKQAGCCFTCSNKYPGCLCPECEDTQCRRYVLAEGRCHLSLEREDKWEELKLDIDAWLKETARAYLVVVDGEEIWVPKSLAKIESSDRECFVVMPKWLAVKKGLYEPDEFDTWKGDNQDGKTNCHPNPNPNSNSNLNSGPGKESYSPEALALRDRVKKGNDKLFQAWLQIRELADKEEWARQMDRWQGATEKLHSLCQELQLKKYTDCLYLEDGQRMKRCLDNRDGFWCQVCPSIYPYWETELMELPSPKVPKSELAAELVALRTRRFLDSRGWCLWKCSLFGGEVIVVVKDETVEGFPKGHPVYTEAELEKLMQGNITNSSLYLVHEAKKIGGAIIVDIDNGGHDGKVQ